MNTEIWKDIPGFEGFYQVNAAGIVRSVDRIVPHKYSGSLKLNGKILRQTLLKDAGYLYVTLCVGAERIKFFIHDIVTLTFIGPKPHGYHVDHEDRNRINNNLSNLSYKTVLDNCGFIGDLHPNRVVNSEIVISMRQKHQNGMTCSAIAKIFNFKYHTVHKILQRKNWKHI